MSSDLLSRVAGFRPQVKGNEDAGYKVGIGGSGDETPVAFLGPNTVTVLIIDKNVDFIIPTINSS